MLAAAFLTAATGLALQQARRRPYVTMGWLWFLVTLVPVLGLVQMGTYSIADRYTYVSLIGIFAMLAWAGGEMASRSERWKRAAIASAAVELRFWQNSGTLFTHALEVTEDNSMAHNNLGFYFFKQGRPDEAMQHYVESARIAPDFNRVWENIFITMADERLDKEKAARYTQLLKSKRRTTGAFRSTPAVMGSVALGGVAGLLFLAVMRRAKTLLPPASPGGPQRK
jgi:tetratricopeptide (TPR) repeat protein